MDTRKVGAVMAAIIITEESRNTFNYHPREISDDSFDYFSIELAEENSDRPLEEGLECSFPDIKDLNFLKRSLLDYVLRNKFGDYISSYSLIGEGAPSITIKSGFEEEFGNKLIANWSELEEALNSSTAPREFEPGRAAPKGRLTVPFYNCNSS